MRHYVLAIRITGNALLVKTIYVIHFSGFKPLLREVPGEWN
jgi:hypothetical protein